MQLKNMDILYTDIIINIFDNPDEPEVSFDSLHYNGYNINRSKKQASLIFMI